MNLNNYILEILIALKSIHNQVINKQLEIKDTTAKLKLNKKDFIQIAENAITINGKMDIGNNILVSTRGPENTNRNKIKDFVDVISNSITGINHLGIGYSCSNMVSELEKYTSFVKGTFLKLYEEDSGSEDTKWFFMGDISNPQNPLFEIVLTQSSNQLVNDWTPHFQIDINTTLGPEEIEEKTNEFFEDSIKWNLDIPNYGRVLSMVVLGEINRTKITLGLGTDLRRKQTLQEIT